MTRFMELALGAVALVAALNACSSHQSRSEPGAPSRSVEQLAWDAIAEGAPVIDVRTDAEFQQGHLPSAVNIPHDQIASRLDALPSDRNRTIVLYCRSGRRSGIAKQTLEELGFTNAINAGGYDALMRAHPK